MVGILPFFSHPSALGGDVPATAPDLKPPEKGDVISVEPCFAQDLLVQEHLPWKIHGNPEVYQFKSSRSSNNNHHNHDDHYLNKAPTEFEYLDGQMIRPSERCTGHG